MAVENVIEVSGRDGITINEYNGKYSLNSVEKGNNEVWYLQYAFKTKWSKESGSFIAGENKTVMSVRLGDDKAAAEATLLTILDKLTGKKYKPDMTNDADKADNVPF